ncbi:MULTISPECIES: type II toxin-antitoxin system VapC family toxin [unclassified Brachybacterium]|uniref:type II toxin-antitoxin system VapC family toxin n=1 Tax=unclassified Brachybacterium TaxID=2623841 RepID=UPI00362135AD
MIVVDASAMIEALISADAPDELTRAVATRPLGAPHLLDIEVLSTLRGLERGRKLLPKDSDALRETHFAMSIARYDAAPLSERIWSLRHRCAAYDASYLALAEGLDAPLLACDERLRAADTPAELQIFPVAG